MSSLFTKRYVEEVVTVGKWALPVDLNGRSFSCRSPRAGVSRTGLQSIAA